MYREHKYNIRNIFLDTEVSTSYKHWNILLWLYEILLLWLQYSSHIRLFRTSMQDFFIQSLQSVGLNTESLNDLLEVVCLCSTIIFVFHLNYIYHMPKKREHRTFSTKWFESKQWVLLHTYIIFISYIRFLHLIISLPLFSFRSLLVVNDIFSISGCT